MLKEWGVSAYSVARASRHGNRDNWWIQLAISPKHLSTTRSADWAAKFQLERFLDEWGNALLATARRNSPTATDADDAYQRAIEKLLTRFPDCESEEHLVAWMHTVIRNEAIDMHRAARNVVDGEFEQLAESLVTDDSLPEDAAIAVAELAWGREALARIRPDQTRCLLLKAEGMSNPEICETTGFSYAKVNRLLSEGRTALSTRARSIESGRECQRIEPLLVLVADEQATTSVLSDVNPHLEHCVACRTTLRELREAPQSIAALLPLGTALPASEPSLWARVGDQFQTWFASVQERAFGHTVAQSGEVITAKKLVAAASIAAALVGGGVVAERSIDDRDRQLRPDIPRVAAEPGGLSALDGSLTGSAGVFESRAAARRAESDGEVELFESARADGAGLVADGDNTDEAIADPNGGIPEGAPEDTGLDVEGLTP